MLETFPPKLQGASNHKRMSPVRTKSIIGGTKTYPVQIINKITSDCSDIEAIKTNTHAVAKPNKNKMKKIPVSNFTYPKYYIPVDLFGGFDVSHNNQSTFSNRHSQNLHHINNTSWRWKYLCLVFVLSSIIAVVQSSATEPSGIQIDPDDGGYTGIVFEIKEEVPEESCAEILKNLKVGFY